MGTNMAHPSVYIVILNYCSSRDTTECTEFVKNISYFNFNILVIDNASPDDSGAVLKSHVSSDEFIQLSENTGYAGGNNVGIRKALDAGADYILILNPDVRLPEKALSDYISIMESDPTIGALNPIQIETDGSTIDHKFAKTILKPMGCSASRMEELDLPEVFEAKELLGAAILLPRHTLEKVGGFDPLYFAYSEEVDLCRRIRLHGLKLCVTTRSPVKHLRSKENEGVSDFVLFLRLKGMCLFKLKDPHTSISRGLARAMKLLWSGLRGKASDQYPFNRYPLRARHILKTAFWLLVHLPKARHHRNLEREGRAHV